MANVPSRDLYNWSATTAAKYPGLHPAPMFDAKAKYQEWIDACRV
jgi:hypothetical protein